MVETIVDLATGNANLLVGLETMYGKSAQEEFAQWYASEEEKMLRAFRDSGIALDTQTVRAIPWYPSVVRS